ncbi:MULTISPECIES: tetratricopeptide repeat protein [unclassified Microcoleus]|uniref:tetratricopeptide repeat protein n=1 Tax=unclassified Microcoleus TaxID=2642155 RepID=UPI002FD22C7C
MNFHHGLSAALIGVTATIVIAKPPAVYAISADRVSQIAKSITVLIDSKEPGSGVIIKREGNTYTVLSARHVFKDPQAKYEIVTPDGSRYALIYSSVKKLPSADLAVVEFTSSKSYTVAKIGNSDLATEGKAAYVAGFPKTSAAINTSIYNFTDGRITANASKPINDDGYSLVYSNNTLPGMSGGPVLNENGEVVAIHGRADTRAAESSNINDKIQIAKTGFNLGIPINTSLRLLASARVDLGVKVPSAPVATGPKADDFYIQGGDKREKGDSQGAINAYNQAIQLNPNYAPAYFDRGNARHQLEDNQGALADYNQALQINPNYAEAYNNRGIVRRNLGDKQGAMADYNQALKINPNLVAAYTNRGNARSNLGDKQGALVDYDKALKIDPNYADAYYNRGIARYGLGDNQGAMTDYNQALRINPKFVYAYLNRGSAHLGLGDKQAALADYNQALQIDPNSAPAYNNRGVVRLGLKDNQGALADVNEALRINPNFHEAYYNRGLTRYQLGDKQGALADYNETLRINPNHIMAYLTRGFIRSEFGDNQGASADYSQAMRIDSNNTIQQIRQLSNGFKLEDRQRVIAVIQGVAKLFEQQGNRELYNKTIELITELQ